MKIGQSFGLQALVFCLVGATFTTIYIPQPVLPVLQAEFGVNETTASFTISAVIFGIALSNLPFGMLADRLSIKPIILTGGLVITACGLVSSVTTNLTLMIAARFIQGLFIPALTTCLAAYLSRMLPFERLNVVMGSYVSATVAGGLGGRLLGGWIHPPLHWRYAFVSASLFLLLATVSAVIWLPKEESRSDTKSRPVGFIALISKWDHLRIFFVAFGAFFVFSSIYNYLPFYLSGPSFNASVQVITLLYLSYVIGIIIGPLAGNLSNRIGNGATMALGTAVFGLSIGFTLIKSMTVIVISLAGICAGYFTIHATAIALLNRKLTSSKGRANSLYTLFYYMGGSIGITVSGFVYISFAWSGVALLGSVILLLPFATGIAEMIKEKA
jgi:MFS transporter, YNFM family, putative membrane transport protein